MEDPKTRREKKGDKSKRNKELNGKYSAKFIRAREDLLNKRNPNQQ